MRTFTFHGGVPQLESRKEAHAVATAISRLLSHRAAFDPDADRVFRRWLGDQRGVDVDLSVRIRGEIRRLVLSIARAPLPGDPGNLRLRIIAAKADQ